MAGPWLGIGYDEEYLVHANWKAGDIVEVLGYDYDHNEQGSVIFVVVGPGERPREFLGNIVGTEDDYYTWWAFESGECEHPSTFKMATTARESGKKVGGRYVNIVSRWRVLGSGGVPDLSAVGWLRKTLRDTVEGRIAEALPRARMPAAEGTPEGALRPRLFGEVESKPRGRGVAGDLEDLRRSVDADRGRRHGPREGRGQPAEPERRSPERRRVYCREEEAPRARSGSDDRRPLPRRERPRSPRRQGDTRQARRPASPTPPVERGRRRSPAAAPRDGGPARDASRRRRSPSRGGRGRRHESRSRSRSRSVFHDASSSSSRHTQARLLSWAKQHPGLLAARLLQSMEDRVGRDGEAGSWAADAMPAAAKSYYYRVLRVTHSHSGLRSMREMATLCSLLDHLAKGRFMEAADVVGQRLKAVEAALVEGNWDRAQFLELVQQDGPLLAERGEQHMTARELEFTQRLSGKGNWRAPVPLPASSSGGNYEKGNYQEKGNYYEKGKKGKGGKSPGKGKVPKGPPAPVQG